MRRTSISSGGDANASNRAFISSIPYGEKMRTVSALFRCPRALLEYHGYSTNLIGQRGRDMVIRSSTTWCRFLLKGISMGKAIIRGVLVVSSILKRILPFDLGVSGFHPWRSSAWTSRSWFLPWIACSIRPKKEKIIPDGWLVKNSLLLKKRNQKAYRICINDNLCRWRSWSGRWHVTSCGYLEPLQSGIEVGTV